jgi:predicted transcriptional regulator of viral defense system
MRNSIIPVIQDTFKKVATFDSKDLYSFLNKDTEMKESTFHWKLYEFTQKGILEKVGRGKYRLGERKIFKPILNAETIEIYQKLSALFPQNIENPVQFCYWHTSVLNELMNHQPARFFILIETEKEVTDSVFHLLREQYADVFINPAQKEIDDYIAGKQGVIIIKNLKTEAPTQLIEHIPTITIEKLLVDIYCDENLFVTYQEPERETIFRNAFKSYVINESKLFRYARRRCSLKKLQEFKRYVEFINSDEEE